MKKWIIFIIAFFVIGVSFIFLPHIFVPVPPAKSFDDCVLRKDAITLDSYPAQCRTKDGKSFTQDIGNELELIDQITLSSPRPNQLIASPLDIKGQARGTWYFEAVFSAKLVDENNDVLATAILQAETDWMTEDFVPFTGQIKFQTTANKGTLLLEAANPSGLAEHAKSLRVPVKFR